MSSSHMPGSMETNSFLAGIRAGGLLTGPWIALYPPPDP